MYVISYDITKDRLRSKVAKLMEENGKRVQYSVFECNLGSGRFKVLYNKLARLMQEDELGSVRIYNICGKCETKTLIIGNVKDDKYIEDEDIVII